MARGRPKTPIEKMRARSPDGKTPGHRNLPEPRVDMKVDRSIPELPDGVIGRGALEWSNIWTAGWWLARDQDHYWVEMICRAYTDIEEYRAYVVENGLITKGYAGQDAANPMIAEIRKSEQTIQKCLQVLGFSPTDRAKLMITMNEGKNALQEMIEAQSAGRH